jgi:hypothetical protein
LGHKGDILGLRGESCKSLLNKGRLGPLWSRVLGSSEVIHVPGKRANRKSEVLVRDLSGNPTYQDLATTSAGDWGDTVTAFLAIAAQLKVLHATAGFQLSCFQLRY